MGWSADLGTGRVDPVVSALCEDAAARFETLGCHVEVVMPTWGDPEEIFRVIVAAETWQALGDRLREPGVEWSARSPRSSATARPSPRASTSPRSARRREFWTDVQRFLARFDFLVTPTVAVLPFPVGARFPKEINGEPISPLGWMPFTYPFNLTGQPAANVPVGFTGAGLPVGLQIVGRRHADRAVLAASAAFEAAAPWQDRRPPEA